MRVRVMVFGIARDGSVHGCRMVERGGAHDALEALRRQGCEAFAQLVAVDPVPMDDDGAAVVDDDGAGDDGELEPTTPAGELPPG